MGLLDALFSKKKEEQPAASPLGGLIGGLAGSGGLGALLGNLDVGQLAGSAMVANVVAQVAEKVGIPTATAQTIVEFALDELLPLLTGQAAEEEEDEGLDLANLAQHLLGSERFDMGALVDNDHVQSLAGKAGIDEDTARNGLNQSIDLLMDQMGSGGLDLGGLLGGAGG